ncbi:hypothetical protein MMC25_005546 [Agyrium rufum]|nr:hypothetical protein [Agyrium rufum]
MADLDAELLALAGDSSDDESPAQQNNTDHNAPSSHSASPPPKDRAPSPPQRGVARKTTTKSRAKRGAGKSRQQDSDEDGDASLESEESDHVESAAMSESDAEGEADEDATLYPVENKFKSEKDRAEIMALPEVQREAILAERAAEIDRKQQDQTLRRLLQNYQDKDKKRKADAADINETHRKSSRQKTTLGGRKVGETSDAIEAYKRKREEKGALTEQRRREGEERKDRRQRGEVDEVSEPDADGESEVEWDDGKAKGRRRSPSPKEQLPAELRDYNRVRVGRDNFAKICFTPGFEEKVKSCFVRINIGPDERTRDNVYRVARIKEIKEGKLYAMEGANGKIFTTSQVLILSIGKSDREFPFLACSNSPFTESELDRYKRTMAAESLALPTKTLLLSKCDDINAIINHRWTNEDIQEKIRRSGNMNNKFDTLKRNTLTSRRHAAEARGDEAEIMKIDSEIAALDGPKLAYGTSLLKREAPKKEGKTQQERLAELNRINRKQNVEDVRRAQQAERKKERLAQEAVDRGEAVTNPHARVKTRAKIMHDTRDKLTVPKAEKDDLFGDDGSRDVSRSGTPLPAGLNGASKNGSAVGTPKRGGTPLPGTATPNGGSSSQNGTATKKKSRWGLGMRCYEDDDLAASLDFGIDIEI